MQAQFRVVSNTTWDISYANSTLPSLQKGRFQIDTTANPQSQIYLNGITGTRAQDNSRAFDNLGSKMLCFGHSPNYAAQGFLKGKYRRIAISDVALAQGDFVLDNLLDPEEKRTLAYWTFAGFDDKAGASGNDLLVVNASRRNGALLLGGQTSYAETSADLDLSTLSQVTVECFVLFGETPSGGTLFGLGEGAGSFAVSGDAVAGKLSGAFQPYQASYSYQQVVTDPETSTETTNTLTATVGASNGGVTELAPLAGVKAWHHVALVIDRTATERDAVRLYVDYERAELAGRAWDSATRLLDGKLVIGASAAYDNFFAGCIDDVRVSAGALEPSEFLQPNQRTEAQDGMIVSIR